MTRATVFAVPPKPQEMTPRERFAWRLWRSGRTIRYSAQSAGITTNQLRALLGLPLNPRTIDCKIPNEVSA